MLLAAAMLGPGMAGPRAREVEAGEAGRALLLARPSTATMTVEEVPGRRGDPSLYPAILPATHLYHDRSLELQVSVVNLGGEITYNAGVALFCVGPGEKRPAAGASAGKLVPVPGGALGLLPYLASETVSVPVPLDLCDLGRKRLFVEVLSGPHYRGSFGGYGREPGEFNKPSAVVAFGRGRLLVADEGNHRLQVVREDGRPLRSMGRYGDRPGEFHHPSDVAWDERSRRLFVCDQGNHRIQVLGESGRPLAILDGRKGGDGLSHPSDLALSPDGQSLYVADAGNLRIVRMSAQGEVLGSWGRFGEGEGEFREPRDVETDAEGRILVVDGVNRSVQVFSPEGKLLHLVDGRDTEIGRFTYPTAVFPLRGERFLVTDFGGDKIALFSYEGNLITWFGRAGEEPGALDYPSDLLLRGSRLDLTETKSGRVKSFDLSGWGGIEEGGRPATRSSRLPTKAVTSQNGAGRAGERPELAERGQRTVALERVPVALRYPEGMASGGDGTLFVVDRGGARVVQIAVDGTVLRTWSLPRDDPSFPRYLVDVALESDRLYALDRYAGRVLVFWRSGGFLSVWGNAAGGRVLQDPVALTVAPTGEVLVLDAAASDIKVFRSDGTLLRTIGREGSDAGGMNCPHDLAIAPDGTVFVTDSGNRRLQRYRLNGTPLGPVGSYGDGLGDFRDPTGIAVGHFDDLLVMDFFGHRIQEFGSDGREDWESRRHLPDGVRFCSRIVDLGEGVCAISCGQLSGVYRTKCSARAVPVIRRDSSGRSLQPRGEAILQAR